MPSSSALVFFLKKVLKASGGTEEQEYAEVFTKGRYKNKNLSGTGGPYPPPPSIALGFHNFRRLLQSCSSQLEIR